MNRRRKLLAELVSYNPDIMLLQDVDQFTEWWGPSLEKHGYDGHWRARSDNKDVGVAIFFRRNAFRLVRTHVVYLNEVQRFLRDPRDRARAAASGDVALLATLFPHPDGPTTCPVHLVSAELAPHEGEHVSELRQWQTMFLLRELQTWTADMKAPLLIGLAAHSTPATAVYHMVRLGRRPAGPQPPGAPPGPWAHAASTSSLRVLVPRLSHQAAGDSRIRRYIVQVQTAAAPGCAVSSVHARAFYDAVTVPVGENDETTTCMIPVRRPSDGTMAGCPVLCVHVCGLVAGATYRVRVVAESSVGRGEPSMPTVPVELPASLAEAATRQRYAGQEVPPESVIARWQLPPLQGQATLHPAWQWTEPRRLVAYQPVASMRVRDTLCHDMTLDRLDTLDVREDGVPREDSGLRRGEGADWGRAWQRGACIHTMHLRSAYELYRKLLVDGEASSPAENAPESGVSSDEASRRTGAAQDSGVSRLGVGMPEADERDAILRDPSWGRPLFEHEPPATMVAPPGTLGAAAVDRTPFHHQWLPDPPSNVGPGLFAAVDFLWYSSDDWNVVRIVSMPEHPMLQVPSTAVSDDDLDDAWEAAGSLPDAVWPSHHWALVADLALRDDVVATQAPLEGGVP